MKTLKILSKLPKTPLDEILFFLHFSSAAHTHTHKLVIHVRLATHTHAHIYTHTVTYARLSLNIDLHFGVDFLTVYFLSSSRCLIFNPNCCLVVVCKQRTNHFFWCTNPSKTNQFLMKLKINVKNKMLNYFDWTTQVTGLHSALL